MNGHDVFLLSPEISLVGLGLLVMSLDLLLERKNILPFVAALGLALPFALSVILWGDVHATDEGSMIGIFGALTVDKFALFFKFLVLGITGLVIMASVDYRDRLQGVQGEFLGLLLFSAAGMMLLAATTELISIYVSLELTTLPLIALSAFLMSPRSSEAGLKFLVLGGISSAFLLYGMVLVYGLAGSTYLADIAKSLGEPMAVGVPFGGHALLLGIILILAGFAFKIASVPFQMWIPDVYEVAPTPVVAFLSVASKAAGFAVVLRVFYIGFPAFELDWAWIFAILAATSMVIGNVVAMVQSNIKRLLGYSTVAHAGYMMVGLAAIASRVQNGGEGLGPSSLLFYLGAYAATNLTVFFTIIAISNKVNSDKIDDFAGMARRAPFLSLVLAFGLISLIGVPPTGLFIGKIFLFTAAVQSDLAWLAILGVLNSVVSAYYYLRVIRVMYMVEPVSEEKIISSVPFRLALGVSGIAVLVLGVAPGLLTWVTDVAAIPLMP